MSRIFYHNKKICLYKKMCRVKEKHFLPFHFPPAPMPHEWGFIMATLSRMGFGGLFAANFRRFGDIPSDFTLQFMAFSCGNGFLTG